LTDGSKLSAAEAQQIEQQLLRDPEDIAARAKLISYYFASANAHPRQEHIFWLIEHHPESQIASYFARSSLISSSQADYDRARTLWLEQVAAHPNDARVLAHAGGFIGEKDQFAQEDLLKRAREVDPSNPEWPKRLADLFTWAIARAFLPGQIPAVPSTEPAFAAAARAELETSTDAALVGTVGEFLAGGPPAGGVPEQAQRDYAQHLLNRAQSLDTSNMEWSTALSRLHENAPAPPPPSGVQRIRVGATVQQSNRLRYVDPVYPPLARQARIQGVVRFNVIIGRDGYVSNITLVNGHPLLVPAAQEAVKQWVYRPTLLNGDPVEVSTFIDVNFMLPHEN
jgi:TonB family protein